MTTALRDTKPAPRLFSRPAVVASCAGFVLIGALQALYGPALPALRQEHGLSPSMAGLGLSAHFVGGVAGVLLFDAVHGRIGSRRLLTVSYALMAVGGGAFALAPDWPFALGAALLTGLGFGGIDYGLNQLFAVGFGDRGAAMLNVLNAHFGIGAVAGPALLAALGPDRYAVVFAGCAVLAGVLALSTRGVRAQAPPAAPATPAGREGGWSRRCCWASWRCTSCMWGWRRGSAAGSRPIWSPWGTRRRTRRPRRRCTG